LPQKDIKSFDGARTKAIVNWKGLLAIFEEKRILMNTFGLSWRDVWIDNGVDELKNIFRMARIPNQSDLVGGWSSYAEGFGEHSDSYIDRMAEQVAESTARKMKKTIIKGLDDGLPVSEIAEQISSDTAFNFKRARVIARTEATRVHGASNLQSMVDAKSFGVKVKKAWLANRDSRTRDEHLQLALDYGSKENAIEPEELFVYGNDSAPAPGEFGIEAQDCNCRCTIKPVVVRE
tara:strand:+ start:1207 stop:1908 length:702 start_codon:yes stop_codon:yes gene_type:complete